MDAATFEDILASVRRFAREQVLPREVEIEEKDELPEELRRAAADMGMFGVALPTEYGGLGLGVSEEARLAIELGYVSLAFRSLFGTNNGIAGQVLVGFGTDEQKSRWLPRMASGDAIASFCLTEPEAGSNPAGLKTVAVRDGDDYVINGGKRFITNAATADVLMVFARTDPEARGSRGISVFAVPSDTPGVEVGPRDKKMGQAGAWSSEVFFDGVRVPARELVGGEEGKGYHAAMASLVRGRVTVAALAVGAAQRCVDESVAYARTARQGGRPIGDYQLVQALIAESQAELSAGRALVLDAAAKYDSGEDRKIGPSSAKLFCTEMAGRVADRAVQVHGGMGYMRGVPVERIYRDVRLLRIYEGTSEIQKLIIADGLLHGDKARPA